MPLSLVDGAGGDAVVELVEVVDEVLDGDANVVRQELEAFEFDDDGEASKCGADLGGEDGADAFVGFALEVDEGLVGGGRGVGSCRNAFGEARLLYAVCKREVSFGGDVLTVLAGLSAGFVEARLVFLSEEAGARGLGFVVDVAEDCAYVLGRVLVGVTGLSTCV